MAIPPIHSMTQIGLDWLLPTTNQPTNQPTPVASARASRMATSRQADNVFGIKTSPVDLSIENPGGGFFCSLLFSVETGKDVP